MKKNKKNLKKADKIKILQNDRRIKVIKALVGTGGKMAPAMREAGYSDVMVNNPQRLTKTKTWNDLLEEHLPDSLLTESHVSLLKSTRLDHMVFPLEHTEKKVVKKRPKPADEDMDDDEEMMDAPQMLSKEDILTDKDIKEMLLSVNCTVKRIVHGETCRHVYFWSSDNKAKKEALEMAYKLKSRFTEKTETKHIFTGYEELTDEELTNELATISKPIAGTENKSPIPPQGEAKA